MNDNLNLSAEMLWDRMLQHLKIELSEITFLNHFGNNSRGI
jgi:hypothetical protein